MSTTRKSKINYADDRLIETTSLITLRRPERQPTSKRTGWLDFWGLADCMCAAVLESLQLEAGDFSLIIATFRSSYLAISIGRHREARRPSGSMIISSIVRVHVSPRLNSRNPFRFLVCGHVRGRKVKSVGSKRSPIMTKRTKELKRLTWSDLREQGLMIE